METMFWYHLVQLYIIYKVLFYMKKKSLRIYSYLLIVDINCKLIGYLHTMNNSVTHY